jgi:hypothetical protein
MFHSDGFRPLLARRPCSCLLSKLASIVEGVGREEKSVFVTNMLHIGCGIMSGQWDVASGGFESGFESRCKSAKVHFPGSNQPTLEPI